MPMWSLKERVQRLEDDLRASPMRHYAYDDLPFAIFCYQPDQEWAMRREIELLRTRLRQSTARTIETVSLADLMWQSIEESEGLDAIRELEHRSGFTAAENQVFRYLSDRDWRPLPGLLLERLKPMQQDKHLVLITRAATLAPNI